MNHHSKCAARYLPSEQIRLGTERVRAPVIVRFSVERVTLHGF